MNCYKCHSIIEKNIPDLIARYELCPDCYFLKFPIDEKIKEVCKGTHTKKLINTYPRASTDA